jgi:hypothetical protein
LGFFRDGEGAVIYGCEVEVVKDFVDVVFFFGGFGWCYDGFVGGKFLILRARR